jgi:bifunctional dethiobiotin synthetase / adenosylmethionine---8-amino-7-oxononanoate aminotransferase
MFRRLLHHARRRRRYSSSSSSAAVVPLSTPTFAVFGANTGVGKTLVSAGLSAALLSSPNLSAVNYLKPLQTGYPADSDARFVFTRVPALLRASSPSATPLVVSCRTLFPSLAVGADLAHCESEENVVRCGGEGAEETKVLACRTVYAWREPVSPHLAAEREGMAVTDEDVRKSVAQWLVEDAVDEGEVWKVLETAGGVASPGPSGTLQCDLYRCVPFAASSVF